jgi:mxaK protein
LLILLVVVIGVMGYRWRQAAVSNARIVQMNQGNEIAVAEDAPPEVWLAKTMLLKRQQRYDEALDGFNRILGRGDKAFQTTVYYHLGNLYLAQALTRIEETKFTQATPLVALAKDAYREVLRRDSQHWDAKYNLALALRLVPELEEVDLSDDQATGRKQEMPWTEVPGFPRGLP